MSTFSAESFLSERVTGTDTSGVRALFAAAARPEVISFAAGSPFLGTVDYPAFVESSSRVLLEHGPRALQYSPAAGVAALREEVAKIAQLDGIEADPDEFLITPGSQFGLDMIAKTLLNPGDIVLAESPSYAGGMIALQMYQADVRQVGTDADGLDPDAVEQAILQARSEGRRVKFVYTIPTYQNPGGTVMPPERRARLVELAHAYDILIVEDNAYNLLGFDGTMMRAMAADERDRIVYIGSFSKFVGPGIRLGWILPPRSLYRAFFDVSESALLNPPTFAQMVLADHLANHDWMGELGRMREVYREKCAVMLESLDEIMPAEATWNRPRGGFYIWVKLPERYNAYELDMLALDRGVGFVPGTSFYLDGRGTHEFRLSYCLPTIENIREGMRRLGAVFAEYDAAHDGAPQND